MSQRTSSFANTNKNETKTKTKVVAYNLEQLKGALEVGPIVLLVHLSSPRCLSGVATFGHEVQRRCVALNEGQQEGLVLGTVRTGCGLAAGGVGTDVQVGSDPQVLQHVKQVLHVLDQEFLQCAHSWREPRVCGGNRTVSEAEQVQGQHTESTRKRPSASEPLVNRTQRSMAASATRKSLDAELSTRRSVSAKPAHAWARTRKTYG